jgi:hypothetical protein
MHVNYHSELNAAVMIENYQVILIPQHPSCFSLGVKDLTRVSAKENSAVASVVLEETNQYLLPKA